MKQEILLLYTQPHMRFNVTNQPDLKTFRTKLRNHLTPAEAKFWTIIQNSKLDGRKFRRQQSIGKYVLDFYCPKEKLAIELDGEGHFSGKASLRDRERRLFIEFYGIKVIRFENKLVFENLEWVLERIRSNFGWWLKAPGTPEATTTPSAEAAATQLASFQRRGARQGGVVVSDDQDERG